MSATAARLLYGDTISAAEAADPNSSARRASSAHAAGREVSSDKATLERDGVEQLLRRLKQLRGELLGVIAGASTDFRRFTAGSLIGEIDALIAEANADLARLARSTMTAAAGLGQAAVDEPIKAARVGIPFGAGPGLDAALVTAAFDNAADLLTVPMQQFRNQIVQGVRKAALAGGSSAEQMKAVAASIDTAGGFSNAAFSAERAFRTELGRTLNTSTFARLEALARELTFLRKGWRAAKDGRTRQGHIEAAATYARGSGIPIAQLFKINVYQETPNKPGATRGAAKLLGVAFLRYPIDPDATPAGRLAAGATIMCRCGAFVDFDLAELKAYSINRARGISGTGTPPIAPAIALPPEPAPIVKARRAPVELTADKARAKLQKLTNKQALDKVTLQRQASDAYEAWYRQKQNPNNTMADLDALRGRYAELMGKAGAYLAGEAAAQRRILYVDPASRRTIRMRVQRGDRFGFTNAQHRATLKSIRDGVREAGKFASAGTFGDSGVLVRRVRNDNGTMGNRANATQRNNAINLSEGESVRVVVHELGHLLEFNSPDIQAAAFRFYERRTAGESLKKLKDLKPGQGYEDNEVVREDKFANIYAGKEYMLGSRRYATEIVSLGLEWFYARPAEFAREDPDFFDFIFNALRGRFR